LTKRYRGQERYADGAYTGKTFAGWIQQIGLINQVHEKGYKNNPLFKDQNKSNKLKSKTRARIEYIFWMITNRGQRCMQLLTKRYARARVNVGLTKLGCNLIWAAYLREAYGIAKPI